MGGKWTEQERQNYCKDCKRSIYGEYKDCDTNIDNNGYYPCNWECHCKVNTESEVKNGTI